jgi:hypothetical protein
MSRLEFATMRERINPLFDEPAETHKITTTAGTIVEAAAPNSPITNRPMMKVWCGDVPAYVDMENRIVLPVREQ